MNRFAPESTIFIIDGSSFLYRSYYALKPLQAKSGEPVHAVYGFCRLIKKLITQYNPEWAVVVWDTDGSAVREELYTEYKATREAAPSDLQAQKARIQEFCSTIGLAQVSRASTEADDLMASIARQAVEAGFTPLLMTSDKDMLQCVSDTSFVFDPIKEKLYDVPAVVERFGFGPEKIIFYFSLIGDSADNIPGVAGIGPKTATELVTAFSSLSDLYKNLNRVPRERTRNLLEIGRDAAFLSEQLFTLQQIPLETECSAYRFDGAQWSEARQFFAALNFVSLLKELGASSLAPEYPLVAARVVLVATRDQLRDLCRTIRVAGFCAVDTETDGAPPLQSQLAGISLCCARGEAYYVPLAHETSEAQLSLEEAMPLLKEVLEDPAIKKYLHNAKFDLLVLYHAGIHVHGLAGDTLIAAHLVVDDGQRIGLKALSQRYLQEKMIAFDEVVTARGYKKFTEVPIALGAPYAAADAHQTLALVPIFDQLLESSGSQMLYHDIELPLVSVLYHMEREGIRIDTEVLDRLDTEVTDELLQVRRSIIALIPDRYAEINLNSPKQLEELLFGALGLEPIKKTAGKTGYSTDSAVLEELARQHMVPHLIVRYRELFKIKTVYVDGLRASINPYTGRIHTSFSQISTATGRLSSSDPNLQNIPADGARLKTHVRQAFVPQEGHLFVSADYSQIELRVAAYLSQDPELVDAFLRGEDVHAHTAAGLFSVPIELVTSEQRAVAKRINFSLLYGVTPYGLSRDLGISQKLAKEYMDRYFERYSGIKKWMDSVVDEARENGYVATLWGRRRAVPAIHEKNRTLFEAARRIAINTKGQGTAAELMKKAMIRLEEKLIRNHPAARMLLQIHDELLLSAPQAEVHAVECTVRHVLQTVVEWNVPLTVTTRIGADWMEASK
jgi:DNA polymerase-1